MTDELALPRRRVPLLCRIFGHDPVPIVTRLEGVSVHRSPARALDVVAGFACYRCLAPRPTGRVLTAPAPPPHVKARQTERPRIVMPS